MNFRDIEPKWQEYWEEKKLFKTPENPGEKKYYDLVMFAYPSGDIHIGHFRNYAIGDVMARFKKMQGFSVFHPFGWDAFGLPAEEAAIKRGIHPREWTLNNIDVSRSSLKRIGISYDWDREVITCLPDYYRWNQWIFLKMFEKGLAYQAVSLVNWCPHCKTVLANEQVQDGRCWRCHQEVTKKELLQWFFKITAYAERLLNDLDSLDGWPLHVKTMQRNWIGKSQGSSVVFKLEPDGTELPVYTTRPDTLFGVTFVTIAPEHPLSKELSRGLPQEKEVLQFIKEALMQSEIVRTAQGEKNGVFTGRYVIHPLTRERVELWIGDYVLASYGTGIVMGVPAHDQRDFLFAKKYYLPIKVVIEPPGKHLTPDDLTQAFEDPGTMANSGEFTGLPSVDGMKAVTNRLKEKGLGDFEVRYKLRDWLISRQRYWGTPIPIVHCRQCGAVPVPYEELPVRLPEGKIDFVPKGRSPLEDVAEFFETSCPKCGHEARRDPDTMDTFVDSSWYFLRYLDPKNEKIPFDPEKAKAWLPVDQYTGGVEHATGHLLYFRFFTKVLHDLGCLSAQEPALRLFNHGMVLDKNGEVMSKSKGNAVSPSDLIDQVGADTARIAILFAAPAEKELLWSEEGIGGALRFLNRVWRLAENLPGSGEEAGAANHEVLEHARRDTVLKVTGDIERFSFHTALAALMELLNLMEQEKPTGKFGHDLLSCYAQLLAPFAPHFAEEIWTKLGNQSSIFESQWPMQEGKSDILLSATIRKPEEIRRAIRGEMELVVQVNGKVRDHLSVPVSSSEVEIKARALDSPKVKTIINGKEIKKIVIVPKKLVNIVCA